MTEIKRDDGFSEEIELFQADGVTPFVVTGRTLLAQLRNREALVADLTVVAVSSPNGNVVRVSAPASLTRNFPVSDARNVLKYDIAVIDGASDPVRTPDMIVTVLDQQTVRAV
jgi:hypothetical protein